MTAARTTLSIRAATVFFLLQVIEAFSVLDRAAYGEWDGKGGDKLTQLLNLLFIACALRLFAAGWRRVPLPAIALASSVPALLTLSYAWSIDPPVSFHRGIEYGFMVLGAIGIAGAVELDEFVALLQGTIAITAVVSLVLLVAAPGLAHMDVFGTADYRGVFPHKNLLGQVMAAGGFATLHQLRIGRPRPRQYALMLLFVVVATLSRSASALIVIGAYSAIHVGAHVVRRHGTGVLLVLIALGVPVAAIGAHSFDTLLELIGKDPTLTGRTELWAYVWNAIDQRPVLGWGYSCFWSPDNPAATAISDALQWYVPQAHSGLLEVLLDVGAVGVACFAVILLRFLLTAVRCFGAAGGRAAVHVAGVDALLVLAGVLVTGVSESVMLEPFQIANALLFVTGLICERQLRPALPRRRAPAAISSGWPPPRRSPGW